MIRSSQTTGRVASNTPAVSFSSASVPPTSANGVLHSKQALGEPIAASALIRIRRRAGDSTE
jgi:hypothetical protein